MQTRKEKRAGAIRRLERHIANQRPVTPEEIKRQEARKAHLAYLNSIKDRK